MADVIEFPERPPPDIRVTLKCPQCECESWKVTVHGSFWPVKYNCTKCPYEVDLSPEGTVS